MVVTNLTANTPILATSLSSLFSLCRSGGLSILANVNVFFY
jgi:hypothetical protein